MNDIFTGGPVSAGGFGGQNPLDFLLPSSNADEAITFRWGTVVSVSPLQITLDGDAGPLLSTPVDLGGGIRVTGSRVYCMIYKRAVTVLGPNAGIHRAINLGANVNLNTLGVPGTYVQKANANTSLALNYPVAEAGLLEVFNTSDLSTENMLHQRYTRYGGTSGGAIQVYHRRYYPSGGGWNTWMLIAGAPIAYSTGYTVTSPATVTSFSARLYPGGLATISVAGAIGTARTAGQSTDTPLFTLPADLAPAVNLRGTSTDGDMFFLSTSGAAAIDFSVIARSTSSPYMVAAAYPTV